MPCSAAFAPFGLPILAPAAARAVRMLARFVIACAWARVYLSVSTAYCQAVWQSVRFSHGSVLLSYGFRTRSCAFGTISHAGLHGFAARFPASQFLYTPMPHDYAAGRSGRGPFPDFAQPERPHVFR